GQLQGDGLTQATGSPAYQCPLSFEVNFHDFLLKGWTIDVILFALNFAEISLNKISLLKKKGRSALIYKIKISKTYRFCREIKQIKNNCIIFVILTIGMTQEQF